MPRALLSVYDKTGLVSLAQSLHDAGYELIASGGTARALQEAGLTVTLVEQISGVGELLGGRVKTLHPAIHAGILARGTPSDREELARAGYSPIEIVVCNLYPFQQTIASPGVSLQDAIEQIDIGGVALLRAAAKNFLNVTVVCSPDDYPAVQKAIESGDGIDIALRKQLAVKVFAYTRDYDTAIHAFISREIAPNLSTDALPAQLSIAAHQVQPLRYGENPHQQAAYYAYGGHSGLLGGQLLAGKELSYNNILDLDAAWRAVNSFERPAVVIVKHVNPIGIAAAPELHLAFVQARDSDPISAFGGVIAVNRAVDAAFVEAMGTLFIEAIAAPAFAAPAVELLQTTRKNCRLLQIAGSDDRSGFEIRSVHHGLLVQRADIGDPDHMILKTVTNRAPNTQEMEALRFAWRAVQHVKSNAIVIAGQNATFGIGGGLPSRVDAVRLAIEKAGVRARGAVLASDAFFPFPDSIELASEAGVTAVIQPGGSIRDQQAIEAADRAGIAMVFTGVRHFRH